MSPADDEAGGDSGRGSRLRDRGAGVAGALARMDGSPKLVTVAKLAREFLPGDSEFGDPLSTAGAEPPQAVGRRITQATAKRPGVLREMGLSALQVWQSLSEAQGRGRGDEELAIMFTDLAGFSSWALEAGDTLALDLLRDVGRAVEPPIAQHHGRVVKWLGDGLMAVFARPADAVAAALQARAQVREVEVEGHRPRLRAGIHLGRPRKLGGDYLGVDVNVAARLAEGASADEVLVSETALAGIDPEGDGLEVRRLRRFKAKGAPKELAVYSIDLAG